MLLAWDSILLVLIFMWGFLCTFACKFLGFFFCIFSQNIQKDLLVGTLAKCKLKVECVLNMYLQQ